MNKKKFSLYDKVANYLMVKSFCIKENGLLHGKMALALTIYHYGIYMKNHIYIEFSMNLLESILKCEESIQTPILNFSKGEIGIGWGIEYLLFKQAEFEYNEKFRQYLAQIDILVKDAFSNDSFSSNYEMFIGVLHYTLIRNIGCGRRKELPPYSSSFVKEMYRQCFYASKNGYNQYFRIDPYIINISTIYPLLYVHDEKSETSLISGFPKVLLEYLKII